MKGALILDATCAPQDINLLNEARENLEGMIDDLCEENELQKPRMNRQKARQDYLLNLAGSKKRTTKRIRKAIRKQLQYVSRDLRYVDGFLASGCELKKRQTERLETIRKVYQQQREMYEKNTHSVPDRIARKHQPAVHSPHSQRKSRRAG